MKRYQILVVVAAGLALMVLLLLPRRGGHASAPETSGPLPPPQELAATNSDSLPIAPKRVAELAPAEAATNDVQLEKAVRAYNQPHHNPVVFYGMVVDQDSNALPNVTLEVEVSEHYFDRSFQVSGTSTNLQRQTGADGRFEVSGVTGHMVRIESLTKEGYEPEIVQKHYGEYGAQSGSFSDPIIFRMWAANIHEPLIEGEKSFVVIPDGRHYAIDLVKGTIVEGEEGDLLVWIKRPDKVGWREKYAWSCELAAPGGGLLECESWAMFRAPELGYTNVFAHTQEAGVDRWGSSTGEKRFYVKVRNGGMYGRITVALFTHYNDETPGLIHLSYAVNPSGSRLLR